MTRTGGWGLQATQRVEFAVLPATSPGRVRFRFARQPQDNSTAQAAALLRGMLPGEVLDFDVVTDPSADPALKGEAGLSAYQLARQQGYGGTLTQWLATLNGAAGASAYQLARANGYGGTETQWLASLQGAAGANATTLLGSLTVTETATVAIAAGLRRVVVATPTAWAVAPGQDFLLCPTALPAGSFAVHHAIATAAHQLTVTLTVPLITLTLGTAAYAIPCRARRLT